MATEKYLTYRGEIKAIAGSDGMNCALVALAR